MSRFNTLTARFTRVFGSGVHGGESRFNAGAKPLISSARGLISPETQILQVGLTPTELESLRSFRLKFMVFVLIMRYASLQSIPAVDLPGE